MISPALLVATVLLERLPPQTQAKPVLLSDSSAEMFGPGLQFEWLLGANINESGQILAYVELEGQGVNDDNDNAFILIDGQDVLPVVRERQRSPFGAPVGTMYNIGDAILANDSTVYFNAQIEILNPPRRPTGLWKYEHGNLTQLLAENEPIGDSEYILDGRPGIAQGSANNGVVTGGRLDRPAGLFIALIGERDGVVQVFQPAGPLPGLPDGVTYVGAMGLPGMSPSGALAFAAAITGPGVTPANELAMFAERGGSLQLALRTGDAAVEAGPDVRFSYFTSVAFNERRSLTFRGLLAGVGVTSVNEEAIWFENGGTPRLVARNGALAPGFGDQVVRFSGVGMPGLSGEDKVVFVSQLSFNGETKEGIFSWDKSNGLQRLVSSIEPVPGVEQELYFRLLGIPVVNNHGQVAFQGEACDGNDCFYGIWAQDATEQFRLVIGEGQQFQVGPDDWRIVDGFGYSPSGGYEWATGNESGDRIVLRDDGTLVFSAFFEDRTSGVFTIDTNVVPEPSSGGILLAAIAALSALSVRKTVNAVWTCAKYDGI